MNKLKVVSGKQEYAQDTLFRPTAGDLIDQVRWDLVNQGRVRIEHAAVALFKLNRYVRDMSRCWLKDYIYHLKTAFIRHCSQNNLCRQVKVVRQRITCKICDGQGCMACGDGIYRTHVLLEFDIKIADQMYIWHQPVQQVDWSIPRPVDDNSEYNPKKYHSELEWGDTLSYVRVLLSYLTDNGEEVRNRLDIKRMAKSIIEQDRDAVGAMWWSTKQGAKVRLPDPLGEFLFGGDDDIPF